MSSPIIQRFASAASAGEFSRRPLGPVGHVARASLLLAAALVAPFATGVAAQQFLPSSSSRLSPAQSTRPLPPLAQAARRFLAERGVVAGRRALPRATMLRNRAILLRPRAASPQNSSSSSSGSTAWTPLGPPAVTTSSFGAVTGRITSIAIDPSDSTGNRVYLGTTGGGVWEANNAGTATVSSIVFTPLTDAVAALDGAQDASISIGAISVQPGATGVILAGTGDPNDALDSYYGAGILRSTDGGKTWSLIPQSSDLQNGTGGSDFSFAGASFAGFAWCSSQTSSSCTANTVVAAVSDSDEGDVVGAALPVTTNLSAKICEGLYYSTDGGATWQLATIEDGSSATDLVQSAAAPLLGPGGNAATSVVWNPQRNLFIAAVRYHGYYSSPDGITWTRLANQPGINSTLCPTNHSTYGDTGCPLYRGTLAVNSANGDTFAWSVNSANQDQGIWQDVCSPASGVCTNGTIAFGTQWNTAALESSATGSAATIPDGAYTLALAAVPTGQITELLAGADDLWESTCPVSLGCSWRNTTNSTTDMSAQVGEYQHALAWNVANPLEIFIGNDSGLWRSTDGIAETGPVGSSTDASHFQNLNSSLGSLAEVASVAPAPDNPYTIMAGLGVNGAAGIEETDSTFSAAADWPQTITGDAGMVAIDPANNSSWYINDQPGVGIYLCSPSSPCTPSTSSNPSTDQVVTDANLNNDSQTMPVPATFQVDPLDNTKLLIATCRIWQGTPGGSGWTPISPILALASSATPAASYASSPSCDGNALVRSLTALNLGNGSEVVYVGMYGAATYGANAPGHILRGIYQPATGSGPAVWTWTDLTDNPVANDTNTLNYYEYDISSLAIDPHDATGNTVYATVEGMPNNGEDLQIVYRSTDGGDHWATIGSNLPDAPASSVIVDPQSANTLYLATDLGVYYTTAIASCAQFGSNCWAPFGVGLPAAPAVALSTVSACTPNQSFTDQGLVAATYGRGIWQTPLATAGMAISAASLTPASISFAGQGLLSSSAAQTVTIVNTGSTALTPTSVVFNGDFGLSPSSSADTCTGQSIAPGASCTVAVVFTPQATGQRTGTMVVYANVCGGQLSTALSGTGTNATSTSTICVFTTAMPGSGCPAAATLNFDQALGKQTEVGTVSQPLAITIENQSASPVSIPTIQISNAAFTVSSGVPVCGTGSVPANKADCALDVEFTPQQAGAVTALLTITDSAGTQTVTLSGTGAAAPTATLSAAALTFSPTAIGGSASLTLTISNTGDLPLTNLSLALTNNPGGQFQVTNPCGAQVAAEHPGVCAITVTFTPTQVGTFTGTLTVSGTTTQTITQTVSLSATGVAAPVLSVHPASLTFANQTPGVASQPQTLTVSNTGSSPLANLGFAFSGAAASDYAISSTTCTATLNANANCSARVVDTPTASGVNAATLVVSTSTPGVAAVSVPINSSGQTASGLTATPASLGFGATPLGQTSATQTVTIANSSGSAITQVTLTATAPFAIAQNGCTGSLGVGATCAAALVFKPTGLGASTGTLTVGTGGASTPATVALSGVGFDFTLNPLSPSSQSIIPGQTARYMLSFTPEGSSLTFSFACGTLPTGALCLFKPTTETLSAGVEGNIEVDISASASQAQAAPPHPWRALPLVCGLLLLPLAVFRRRRMLQLAILFVVLTAGVSSCVSSGGGSGGSGGSGGQSGGSGTPTGSYTIPITVTATGAGGNGLADTKPVNAILTVD